MSTRKRVTITPELAHTMRRLHEDGVSPEDIAKRVGVSRSSVRRYTIGEHAVRFTDEPASEENEQLILELADESGVHFATREELSKLINAMNKSKAVDHARFARIEKAKQPAGRIFFIAYVVGVVVTAVLLSLVKYFFGGA